MECDTPLLRRLNGRPQACDPCRARKVACDHGQPTCSRCRKRKETCVYTVSEPRIKGPRIQRPTPPTRSGTSTPSPSAPGYLGFTSHNAVFEETRNSLSLVHGSTLDIESAARRGPRVRACLIEMPSSLREMCLFVLRNLPGPSDDVLSYRFHCRADHWIIASVKATLRSLQESFGEHLANREDTLKLEEMGLTICNNTARPLRDEYPTGQDWLDQFGCSALRWESLGLIWTYWDGSPNANPRTIATSLGYCIELARHFSTANDLLVYLCYRRATIESLITGDAGLLCWRYHADTISLMTFLGLHVGSENADYVPSLRLESKRRLAARIFTIDKVMVSFTGRPPLIGRRYFSTPLPLDIRDEDLLADQATISRARKTLDEDGWNRDGDMHSATLIRARVQIAVIKDELLEFALEDSSKATLESLSEIKARAERIVAKFPQSLIHHPEDPDSPDFEVDTIYSRILIRLEHLQNLFFAERLLLRLGHSDQSRLLIISFEMVTLTLIFWTQQDRFAEVRRDFEWLLMAYAAPGGGILCLELLRPTFHGIHPDCAELSRSTIIQKLSLLIGFLDWVRPPAPNADLCADCKAVIQGVLEHNLNAPLAGGGALETLDWGMPMQLDFNFDLLDTFDWLRAE
ncbi:hypothetical protein FOMG_19228 [Fusarium oxysporum f. sp. melonis 26406]|uniref:Zn(2)-C6 fungal-type domain-containing protein n=1 Tax=Fusarium oxysporum f. sp. melonis 26406 TaxID=1089452 RepID=W9Z614_FUSOX|nr:hypothetical protein FOMG_19228 [Fusarium oxysporum f. sp. melonis 26406]